MRRLAAIILLLFATVTASQADDTSINHSFLRIEAGMHTASIRRVSVSSDGRLLATASDDKTARLWSLPDGRLVKVFRVPLNHGDDGKVDAVALSPDGRLLAIGGWDAGFRNDNDPLFIYLFDTVSGGLIRRLGPVPNVVYDLAFSSDGQYLAAGLWAHGVRVWAAPFTGPPSGDSNYGDQIYGVAFAPHEAKLAVVCYDGNIRVYDLTDGALPAQLKPIRIAKSSGGKRPYSVDYSPDGKKLVVGFDDTSAIDILDAKTLNKLYSPDTKFATLGSLGSVAWSADGERIYGAGRFLANISSNPDDGVFAPIITWDHAGKGPPINLGGPYNTVLDIVRLSQGGMTFSAYDPAFGAVGLDGKAFLYKGQVSADMRNKFGQNFLIAPDATAVRFGLGVGIATPYLFDLTRLTFEPAPGMPVAYLEPRTTSLKIENWLNNVQPMLNGKPLPKSFDYENYRSLAISPDNQSFFLGADWSLYRFDAGGNISDRVSPPSVVWGVNLSADGQVLVAALGDGTIRWYRANDGAELLAMFAYLPDKRWIAWTPSGYYAASPGAEDLIGWHVNGKTADDPVEFFPASRFRAQFYRPDIVQLVLRTRDEALAVKQANETSGQSRGDQNLVTIAPAVIEIVSDPRGIEAKEPQLTLSYRLRTPSGRPVTRIEVKIDGRPVEARGMTEVPEDPNGLLQISVPMPPHDSTVSLIAWTDKQASDAASVTVKWTGAAREAPKSKLFAVLVGVSDYDDADLKLNFANEDARALDGLLKAQAGRGFAAVETKLLVDKDATEDSIEESLGWLNDMAGPNDMALVFMAGHGFTDSEKKFYFLPVGGNPEKLRSTGVSGAILRDALSTIKGKAIFLIDACRSGRAIDGGLGVAFTAFVNELSSAENGVVMFAASTGMQSALERSDWGHGAFTKALLDGLSGKADYEKDGRITAGELNIWLDAEVRRLTNGGQTPVMVAPRAVTEFGLTAVQ